MKNEKTLTPLKAIREYCIGCMNGQVVEIRLCPINDCPFYEYRFGVKNGKESALKVIMKKCQECGEGDKNSIKQCEFKECPVFSYRKGHNPRRAGIG